METHWVEASVLPSGLKAAAIVDLGGGNSGQYFADKCRNVSASTLENVKSSKKDKQIYLLYQWMNITEEQ